MGHSPNPFMPRAGLLLKAALKTFRVTDIHAAMAAVRAIGIKGVSVTIPHKAECRGKRHVRDK